MSKEKNHTFLHINVCLSRGLTMLVFILQEDKGFVQIQNSRYLGIWFASEKYKFLTFTNILTSSVLDAGSQTSTVLK